MAAPYVDGLLMEILRPALATRDDPAKAFTLQVVDQLNQIPCVVAKSIPGGREIDPRFPVINTLVQIDSYATSRPAAQALAEDAKTALVNAWQRRTTTTQGNLTNVTTNSPAVERRVQAQLEGVYRWSGVYSITAVQ